jgi:prephenate dehydrogenase
MKESDFNLAESKVAIIGLGLMGGSLALGLRGKCAAIYGIDPQPATLELALSQHIVDYADGDPANLLPDVDLIILSAPVPAILTLLDQLPSLTPNPCIVMDLGSTKRLIVEAMSRLPERFDPIGGHPLCGKEKLSLANAERTLYYAAPFLLTPLDRTSPRAFSAATQIIEAVGAKTKILEALEHDQILASTSHLPFLIAASLSRATPHEYSSLIGPGFRSTTRLAGTPSSMMMGVLQSNRANILNAIQSFRHSLNDIESLLQNENYAQLELLLNQTRTSYQSLTDN